VAVALFSGEELDLNFLGGWLYVEISSDESVIGRVVSQFDTEGICVWNFESGFDSSALHCSISTYRDHFDAKRQQGRHRKFLHGLTMVTLELGGEFAPIYCGYQHSAQLRGTFVEYLQDTWPTGFAVKIPNDRTRIEYVNRQNGLGCNRLRVRRHHLHFQNFIAATFFGAALGQEFVGH
jgi:hypothetical protein